MFGRESTARINALQGLINLLIADRATKAHSGVDSLLNSSSEASCSQQEHGYFRRTPSLLQELQGLLRRCFLQQVRFNNKHQITQTCILKTTYIYAFVVTIDQQVYGPELALHMVRQRFESYSIKVSLNWCQWIQLLQIQHSIYSGLIFVDTSKQLRFDFLTIQNCLHVLIYMSSGLLLRVCLSCFRIQTLHWT